MHSFLVPKPRAQASPIDVVRDLREYVADLPEHKTTYRLPDISNALSSRLSSRGDTYSTPGQFGWSDADKLLWLAGTWRVPDWFSGPCRAINPHAPTASQARFADGLSQCDCGLVIKRPAGDRADQDGNYTAITEHADDCTAAARDAAKRRMWERRRAIIVNGLRFNHSCQLIGPRCGSASGDVPHYYIDILGLPDRTDLRLQGQIEVGETYLVLNRVHGQSPEAIADAYGVTTRTLSTHARYAREAHGGEAALLDRLTQADDEYDANPHVACP